MKFKLILKKIVCPCSSLLLASGFFLYVVSAHADRKLTEPKERQVVGVVERVLLYPEAILLDAKLTPGSEGNVLHAENISLFRKNGENWVRFTTDDRKGTNQTLERKISGQSKMRTSDGSVRERYLVLSGVCIDDIYFELELGLASRKNFEEEMRIGRDALSGHLIIDPARKKTTKPNCDRVLKSK